MFTIVMPLDGSESSSEAVALLIRNLALYKERPAIHLLHVVRPIASGNIKHFIGHEEINRYYREEGIAALQPARAMLDRAGVPYAFDIETGDPAEVIARYVEARHGDLVMMGTRGMGSVSAMFMGSVAAKVVHLSTAPVLLAKGGARAGDS